MTTEFPREKWCECGEYLITPWHHLCPSCADEAAREKKGQAS